MKWISVKDKLPPELTLVLVYDKRWEYTTIACLDRESVKEGLRYWCENVRITMGTTANKVGWNAISVAVQNKEIKTNVISHWMPLPKPPKKYD